MPWNEVLQWVWNIGGPAVILGVIVYLFYTDRIVTGTAHKAVIAEKDQRIAELWDMVKPALSVAEKALSKSENESRRR